MDTRQYGPALYKTLKQVRGILDEGAVPSETRRDGGGEQVPEGYDDSRDNSPRGK